MALLSQLFRGDSLLDNAAVSDRGHILQGAKGTHVGKIQQALIEADGAALDPDGAFGPATAAAVRGFKTKRQILNYQGQIDDIVGKKTIAALDGEMVAREQRGNPGVNGASRQALNSPVQGDPLVLPGDRIFPARTMLLYFSGVVDNDGLGGAILVPPHGQDVLTDMEGMRPKTIGHLKSAVGFGGSLRNGRGVDQAMNLIRTLHDPTDPRGKLIMYGFSAGGVNSMELCRRLNNQLPEVKVDLLVTVDAAAAEGNKSVDRSVPSNVLRNQNFFQTAPSLNGSHGGPNIGDKVTNTNCDPRFGRLLDFIPVFGPSNRHGAMQDVTRDEAVFFMQRELDAPPRIL